jgi:hypothetical protein
MPSFNNLNAASALNNGGITDQRLDDALIITEAIIPRRAAIQIPEGGRIKNRAARVPKPLPFYK